MAEPDEHQILRGDIHNELSLPALRLESVAGAEDGRVVRGPRLPIGRHPEGRPVNIRVTAARRRARKVDPAFGQDARTFPDAVAQVEQPEAREVLRGRVDEGAAQKGAARVELRLSRHSDSVEQRALHEGAYR